MTRVCLVGEEDVNLQYELLSRETAREALATYEPGQPYENTLAVETVSLGAAVALLNDLDWYLARFVRAAFVREPSIDATEYLSRDLAAAVRDGEVDPEKTGDLLTVYGVDDGRLVEPMYVSRSETSERPDSDPDTTAPVSPGTPSVESEGSTGASERGDGEHDAQDRPSYDLREVEETVVVRVTEGEFTG